MIILTEKEVEQYNKNIRALKRQIEKLEERNERLSQLCTHYANVNAKLDQENYFLKHPGVTEENRPFNYFFYSVMEKGIK